MWPVRLPFHFLLYGKVPGYLESSGFGVLITDDKPKGFV